MLLFGMKKKKDGLVRKSLQFFLLLVQCFFFVVFTVNGKSLTYLIGRFLTLTDPPHDISLGERWECGLPVVQETTKQIYIRKL